MVKACVFVRVCVREGGERYGVCEGESKRKEEVCVRGRCGRCECVWNRAREMVSE